VQPLESRFAGSLLLACADKVLAHNPDGGLEFLGEVTISPLMAVHAHPVCLSTGQIVAVTAAGTLALFESLEEPSYIAEVNALDDAQLVVADLDSDGREEIILLSEPSNRYQHGVLGDAIEANSITIVDHELNIISSYRLPEPYVFEQLRVTVDGSGNIWATRSSGFAGAGVMVLRLIDGVLLPVAEAADIGRNHRWLNLFAATDGVAYAIRTPHIGGPLQRYHLEDSAIVVEDFALGISNHQLGSRNLDLGALIQGAAADYIMMPKDIGLAMRLIRCAEVCERIDEQLLEGPLSSNTTAMRWQGQQAFVYGDSSGGVFVYIIDQ
jgi:hypothetical protein